MAKDQRMLLTTILADGINLGLSKMAESCPGTTYAKLTWLQAWHLRDETYSAGAGRAGQRPVSPAVRRLLGRRHYLVFGWTELG
jgi:hypothetical protein